MSGLLTAPAFGQRIADHPLILVDVGARGEVQPPFDVVDPAALQVIGFEPDTQECDRLNALGRGRYLPVALWSAPGEVDVHVAATASCSSIHPPNTRLLERYADAHVRPRDTVAVARFPTTTLDDALAAEGVRADVVKIDTQGAESDILQGASRTLAADASALIVETWTVPVHAGQGLTGAVMELAAQAGLSLFAVDVAAAWTRRANAQRNLGGRRQVVGLDLLFLRDPADWTPADGEADTARRVKAAAVAEAFGFPDVALELLDGESALERIVLEAAAARVRPRRFGRLRALTGSAPTDPFAPLHV